MLRAQLSPRRAQRVFTCDRTKIVLAAGAGGDWRIAMGEIEI